MTLSRDPDASYLARLRGRLRNALRGGSAAVGRARRFILSRRCAEGGFAGRRGGADLYYTAFAVRALALIGALESPVAGSVRRYLETCRPATPVALSSWLGAAEEIASAAGGQPAIPAHLESASLEGFLESRRTADGGYAAAPGARSGSVYQSFLAGLCYDLAGLSVPRPAALVRFLEGRRREDGGFAERAGSRAGSTNATAAAVALSALLGTPVDAGPGEFLLRMQASEGGWRATTRAPAADLLSTFTALVSLDELGLAERADLAAARRFLDLCKAPEGGFSAGPFEATADVEYTYYGLGLTAILRR